MLDYDSLHANEYNNSYISNVISIISTKLIYTEELEISDILVGMNFKYLIRNKSIFELLQLVISRFTKLAVLGLQLRLLSKFNEIIKTSNGMYLINNIILSNSNGTNNKLKLELEEEIEVVKTISSSNIKDANLSKQIFEEAINQICSSFPFIITLRTGGIVVQNLIIRLITNDTLKNCLKYFLDLLNLSEVAGCSVKKYANKVVEVLLFIPEFCKSFLNYCLLNEKEKNNEEAMKNSPLYNMCSRFRGINVIQLLFEKTDLKSRKLLYKDVKLIYKSYKSEMNEKFKKILKDTLLEVKGNLSQKIEKFIIVKARELQQLESKNCESNQLNNETNLDSDRESKFSKLEIKKAHFNSSTNNNHIQNSNNKVEKNEFTKRNNEKNKDDQKMTIIEISDSKSILTSNTKTSSNMIKTSSKKTKNSSITKRSLKNKENKNEQEINNQLPEEKSKTSNTFQALWHNHMYLNTQTHIAQSLQPSNVIYITNPNPMNLVLNSNIPITPINHFSNCFPIRNSSSFQIKEMQSNLNMSGNPLYVVPSFQMPGIMSSCVFPVANSINSINSSYKGQFNNSILEQGGSIAKR